MLATASLLANSGIPPSNGLHTAPGSGHCRPDTSRWHDANPMQAAPMVDTRFDEGIIRMTAATAVLETRFGSRGSLSTSDVLVNAKPTN